MKGEKGESQYRRKKEIGKGKGNPEELVAKLAELGEKVGEYGAESAGKRKAGCGGQVIAVLGNHAIGERSQIVHWPSGDGAMLRN